VLCGRWAAQVSTDPLGGEKSMSRSQVVPALVDLALAWGGRALLASPAGRLLGSPERITTKCLEQVALWLLFAAIVAIVVSWEKQPLASLWLRPLDGKSVAWGLLFALATICVVIPATEWVRRAAGLAGYAAGVEQVLALPIWFRVVAVITAGVVEETLFRGYAVTRLTLLTGSLWFAGALSVAIFAGLHLPFWGAGPTLSFLLGGVVSTAFFIWRQDLLAMIVGHTFVDAWGLVLTPLFSEWWKEGNVPS